MQLHYAGGGVMMLAVVTDLDQHKALNQSVTINFAISTNAMAQILNHWWIA